ncbi:MAG TPA: helix-turn-helix transcriptional regulator [Bryobacteraceae bacterium]|jgi:transcriptional regulator with XRE-family HTH domain|nr:helix-turn-helix transcriptional regulator [Bryobacteraceae bacterium]
MSFRDLHDRLTDHILYRVRNGEMSERGLARRAGISQPHLHNVLKKKRLFSLESADLLLRELDISLLDLLVRPEDLTYR